LAVVIGLLAGVGFLVVEARVPEPMLRLELFRIRAFSATNVVTLLVYGALGAISFFVVLELQTVAGWSALAAGAAFVPMTLVILASASAFGRLGQRTGPRLPLTIGPLVMALGTIGLLRISPDVDYLVDVLPAVVVFGLGLALLVAPLTATVLGAVPDEHAGIASGVNNAVARAGSLLAVAALPIAVGLHGGEYADSSAFDAAFQRAMVACVALLVIGGALAWSMLGRAAHPSQPLRTADHT
jgi:Na+/melibiose symporter-like transporter